MEDLGKETKDAEFHLKINLKNTELNLNEKNDEGKENGKFI